MPALSILHRVLIALCGYTLLLRFGVAYFLLQKHTNALTTNQLLILSAVAVAPLALALVWEQFKGVKIGKVEVALNEVAPRVDFELAGQLADLRASLPPALINLITEAVRNQDFRLAEINLRCTPYWWSTRLFLLVALATDYTNIERFVIVEKDAARKYVGSIAPSKIRRGLAQSFPELERAYRTIQLQQVPYGPDPVPEITNIVHNWTSHLFQLLAPAAPAQEEQFKELVSSAKLRDWLGNALETETRDWNVGAGVREQHFCRFDGQQPHRRGRGANSITDSIDSSEVGHTALNRTPGVHDRRNRTRLGWAGLPVRGQLPASRLTSS